MKYIIMLLLLTNCAFKPTQVFNGSIEYKGIHIATLSNGAGAIGSLTWNGLEFINSYDHGRELQSAITYDNIGEQANPTEAGSSFDAEISNPSSSKLIYMFASSNLLETKIQAAWWLPVNGEVTSHDTISKRVEIGYRGFNNVIQYDVTFGVSAPHIEIGFESLTAYMPAYFTKFYMFDGLNTLTSLNVSTDGHYYSTITSTEDESHAMGVIDLEPNSYLVNWTINDILTAGGGDSVCRKWSAVSLLANGGPPGDYTFHHLLIIGTLQNVINTIKELKKL